MENYDLYTSLLDLPNLKITNVILSKIKIDIFCETETSSWKCSICKTDKTAVHQRTTRILRDLNIGARYVYLHVLNKQFYCWDCHHYFHEELSFAEANKSFTIRQADFMFLISQHQDYQSTGAILNINAKTVERAVLSKCEQLIDSSLPKNYEQVRVLGIDEQSYKKGKKDYVCVLTDLQRGTYLDILPNRKKETLLTHFKSLGETFCNQITEVSCDCWDTYINVAKECFPNADIVLDRFHFTKQLNESLKKYLKETESTLKPLLKDKKDFSKLKKIVNIQFHLLSDQQLDLLEFAFEKDEKLKEIYFNREEFHRILDNTTEKEIALQKIDNWIKTTTEKQFSYFDDFINSLKNTKNYIANYVKNRVSNAVTEGLNNVLRVIKRFSYGMPNFKNLRLRTLAFFL